MVVWYKVAWIDPLFAAFNAIAPARGHAEDGTIGDLAHAQGVSGHNPDDTPGVQAERQDADSKPEVRAADVDAHLNAAATMEQCVQAVLHAPPAERDRLIYVIYNRRIWRKDNGWRQETYTGSDPHDEHAHFSGDPAADDNDAPWTSILNLGDDMDMSTPVPGTGTPNVPAGRTLGQVLSDLYAERSIRYAEKVPNYPAKSPGAAALALPADVAELGGKVDGIQAGQVDQDAVNAAVKVALSDPTVVAPLVAAFVAGLQSADAQAALVKAANTAEDS